MNQSIVFVLIGVLMAAQSTSHAGEACPPARLAQECGRDVSSHNQMDELFGKVHPTLGGASSFERALVPQLIPFLHPRNADSVLVRASVLAGVHRGEDRVIPHLTRLLDHGSVEVRAAAFSAIGCVGIVDARILDRCLKELSAEGSPSTELPCVQILGYCNRQDERIVTALISTLKRQQRSHFLYQEIIEFLGRADKLSPDSGTRLTVPILISLLRGKLEGKDEVALRYQAAVSLGELKARTPAVVETLLACLTDGEPTLITVDLPDKPMVMSSVYVTVAGASAESLRKMGAMDGQTRTALEDALRNGKVSRTDVLAIAGCLAQGGGSTEDELAWQVISDCLLQRGVYNRSGRRQGLFDPLNPPNTDDEWELRHCQFESLRLVAKLGKRATRVRPTLEQIDVRDNRALRAEVDRALKAVEDSAGGKER